MTTATEHELKTWPKHYEALALGKKRFELRKNDRGYQVGDTLFLREWDPTTGEYSGREMRATVTYLVEVVSGVEPAPDEPATYGLTPGWVVMSINPWIGAGV